MIDLTKNRLPEAVEVDGNLYPVHTSFKFWLTFQKNLKNKNTPPADFDFMYTGEKPRDKIKSLAALILFCDPPHILPRSQNDSGNALDYEIDADYIFAAFMERYGIDLVESDMHWYKFNALLCGLHDTKLNEIIGYRAYENKSGKQDAYSRQMEKLKAAWELPLESDEEDEDLKAFEAQLY